MKANITMMMITKFIPLYTVKTWQTPNTPKVCPTFSHDVGGLSIKSTHS